MYCKNDVLNRQQVQRAAEKAIADIEWSDDGGNEEGDGEMI